MANKRSRGKAGSPISGEETYRRILMLRDEVGMSVAAISRKTGVSRSVLNGLVRAKGMKNVYPYTEKAVLDYFPPRGVQYPKEGFVDSRGTRRRMQAMALQGYSFSEQARRVGAPDTRYRDIEENTAVEAEMAERVKQLYQKLRGTAYEARTHAERIGKAKALRRAERLGYKPATFWYDIDSQELIDGL